MGKIVSNFFVSLDGVVESPDQWHFPYFDDEMGSVISAGMEGTGAFLMGRKLYDEWSEFWPAQGPEMPFAAYINTIPKHVLSTTLTEASWQNASVLTGDAAAAVRELKTAVDGDIAMSGCATTVRWLLGEGLLDELNLLVHPIVVGKGQRLFEDVHGMPLELLSSRALSTGVLHLSYGKA